MAYIASFGGLSDVYEPSEDTQLLLDAALAEARPSDFALEIGCGAGLISRSLSPIVRTILATDINPIAIKMTRRYGIETVRADLFAGIKAKFDLVIFNSPYLPTLPEERTNGWLNMALDGGLSGREVIDRFLEQLRSHLTYQGRGLLLISSLSGAEQVEQKAYAMGLEISEMASEKHFFEKLYVLKLSPARPKS